MCSSFCIRDSEEDRKVVLCTFNGILYEVSKSAMHEVFGLHASLDIFDYVMMMRRRRKEKRMRSTRFESLVLFSVKLKF